MSIDPVVGIILVNYNGHPYIVDCLESLLCVNYNNTRIVVVDNASTDGSSEYIAIHYPSVTLLRLSTNRGFTGGNNEGIRWCMENGCDYLLLLNNDTTVNSDFLSRMLEHSEPDCLLVPKIYLQNSKHIINNMIGSFDYYRGINVPWFYGKEDSPSSNDVRYATMAGACALLIPKQVFEAIGYFDEQYFLYWEDTDLIKRALESGFKIKFVPSSIIYHNESSSTGGVASPLSLYYNHRNRLYFMFKHQKNNILLGFFLLYFTLGRIIYILKLICNRKNKCVIAICKGIIDFICGEMGHATSNARNDV